MMELSSKSKIIKKRHKKKKIRLPESALVPLIKPKLQDGESNWIRLQKIVGPIERESLKQNTKKNVIKTVGLNSNSKDCKPAFNRRVNYKPKMSSQNPKYTQGDNYNVHEKYKKNCSTFNSAKQENSIESSKGHENQSFEFDFRQSSSQNKSSIEEKEIEASDMKEGKKLTKVIAMDCEMVGTGPKGGESIIARVSIVNSYGDCLYDEFVKPRERVTDFRTQISGVRPSNLKNGKDLFEVQKDVLSIIEGRILVGHAIKHDLDVLFISHPRHLIRDTAFYKPFRDLCGGKTPSLKKLTSKILGCDIQSGEHSSVEDAQATMLLYLRQKREWESLIRSQRKRKPKMIENQIES